MDSCGVVGCMDNGVTFTTQEEIHDFQANYPNCNLIGGDVTISGIDIVDLSPLSSIESIFGSLVITDNELLTELTGLSSLLSVDGDLIIGNNSMGGNALLISLSGLDQLYAINGELFIENNPVLNDITSIENINPSSITGLHINNNSSLSLCANECICEYIVNSGSIVNINNNSSGCNDESEVSSACFTGIVDENPKEIFAIFPNPAINNFFVKNKYKLKIKDIIVRNNLGQILIKSSSTSEEIDISDLTGGSYIVEIRSEKTTQRHKLIVSK